MSEKNLPEGQLDDTLPRMVAESASLAESVTRRGRFLLLRKLGEGGMGEVFAAYDEQLDRRVAIKLLHATQASEEARLRLLREAQALAKISHPNVVTIFEVGQLDDEVFLAMEFIDGVTLESFQNAEGRGSEEILAVYLDAGRGIAAAHASGLVHRDFKPTNVMIGKDERVRVLDFGLAHAHGQKQPAFEEVSSRSGMLEAKLTMTGELVGTLAYMSPEQYLGEAVDARSDQFAFCVALYEALCRKHPFGGENWNVIMRRIIDGDRSPFPAGLDVPPRVAGAIMRGLSRKPEDRFPDMNELLRTLGEEPLADPSEHLRHRLLFGGLTLLVTGAQVARYLIVGQSPQRSPVDLLGMALVTLLVTSVVAFLFRKTLMANAYHRKTAASFLIALSLMSASRALGLLRDERGADIVIRDLMVLGGVGAVAHLFVGAAAPHVAWFSILTPFAGILAMTLLPSHSWFFAALSFNLALVGSLLNWHFSARAGRRIVLPDELGKGHGSRSGRGRVQGSR